MVGKGREVGSTNTPEARLRNGAELRHCEQCGAEFWVARWQREKVKNGGRFCSLTCKHDAQRGVVFHRPPNAGDVVRRADGYLLEWAPDHPGAHDGRVLQHRLVIERHIGRPLADDEEVHHVNEIRDDNRPENLEVVKRGEHQRMHNLKRYGKT